MHPIILKNAWICQIAGQSVHPVFGDLHIRDGRIQRVTPKPFSHFLTGEPPSSKSRTEQSIDLSGRTVTLPMVNFHEHFYSRLAKGLPISGPMENFVQILENFWWKVDLALDEEMVAASARLGALESIRQGVTYLFDHHASPAVTGGSLQLIAHVMREHHLRGALCFEVSDRNGPQKTAEALEENRLFIARHADGDIRGMLGLHAPFTLSDDTLRAAGQMVNELNTGIHIHIAEDAYDRDFSLQTYGMSPAERLQKFGLINPDSILVHGVHLTERDYQVLADAGNALAYNPDSNLNNAVGLPRYAEVPAAIPILAGTDGMHANPARSLKQLFLLYRHQGNSMDAAFGWFRKIFFDQLQFVSRYFPDFPRLQTGERADLVVWDYVPPTPLHSDNFWGHFIYGILESAPNSVLQNGQFLLRDHRLQIADRESAIREIHRQGERLYKYFESTQ